VRITVAAARGSAMATSSPPISSNGSGSPRTPASTMRSTSSQVQARRGSPSATRVVAGGMRPAARSCRITMSWKGPSGAAFEASAPKKAPRSCGWLPCGFPRASGRLRAGRAIASPRPWRLLIAPPL
jgi:hypothetical protein